MNQKHSFTVSFVIAAVFIALATALPDRARAITLEWDQNTEPTVRGYRVYSGRQSRVYDTVLDVSNRTLVEISAPVGTTYFAVTAYDADNLESDFSEEVFYTALPTNAPIASPDAYVVTNNIPLALAAPSGVLANDADLDGEFLTAELVAPPTNGLVTLLSDGGFTYVPALNFIGLDAFTYRASDGSNFSPAVTVTIAVVPEPDPQDCSTCFAALDAILIDRGDNFPQVLQARNSVPINETCPKFGVLTFGAVVRSLKHVDDSALNAALSSAAACLIDQLKGEFDSQMVFTAALAPSRWTKVASNQAAAASRKLDRVLAAPTNVRRLALLNAAAASLPKIDGFIIQGDLAPLLLLKRSFAASIVQQSQSLPLTFDFGTDTFTVRDENGSPFASGQYAYSRTAWNKATLILVFYEDAFGHPGGTPLELQLKFGRLRAKMTSASFRGHFTMH